MPPTPQRPDKREPPPFPVRRFAVEEYHRLMEAGVLNREHPVELMEGWIVPKMAHGPAHDRCVALVHDAIKQRIPASWRVRVQSAITTSDSEPDADVSVVRVPRPGDRASDSVPPETALVVETADATLVYDRDAKGRVYARAGIPAYWIINIINAQIEVYTDPTGPDETPHYRQLEAFGLTDGVPLVLEGQSFGDIPVRDVIA